MHKGFPGLRTCCADRKNVIQECKIPSPKAIINGFCMQRFSKAELLQYEDRM